MLTRGLQFLPGGDSSEQSLRRRIPPPDNHTPMAQLDSLLNDILRHYIMFHLRFIRLHTLRPNREHLELLPARKVLDGCERLHDPFSSGRRNLRSSRLHPSNSTLVHSLEPEHEEERQESDRDLDELGNLRRNLRYNKNHNRRAYIYRCRLFL